MGCLYVSRQLAQMVFQNQRSRKDSNVSGFTARSTPGVSPVTDRVHTTRVSMASVFGVIGIDWSIRFIFGYVDPWGYKVTGRSS